MPHTDIPPEVLSLLQELNGLDDSLQCLNFNPADFNFHRLEAMRGVDGYWSGAGFVEKTFKLVGQLSASHTWLGPLGNAVRCINETARGDR